MYLVTVSVIVFVAVVCTRICKLECHCSNSDLQCKNKKLSWCWQRARRV